MILVSVNSYMEFVFPDFSFSIGAGSPAFGVPTFVLCVSVLVFGRDEVGKIEWDGDGGTLGQTPRCIDTDAV